MENREAIHHLIKLYDNLEKFFSQIRYHLKEEYINARDLAISALEKQEADKWIPMTERLPEVRQRVLVQYKDGSMAVVKCNDAGHLTWFYARMVAWKPAPAPYQEDEV